MINYLETKISDIEDADFQAVVDGLCHCAHLSRIEFEDYRFSFMLMAIVKEDPKCLSENYLPVPGILTQKVDRLSPDSAVYHLCRQLADLNAMNIESFDGKKVLSLIKTCSKVYRPKRSHARKPTRNQLRHRFQTELIIQRRQNGDL